MQVGSFGMHGRFFLRGAAGGPRRPGGHRTNDTLYLLQQDELYATDSADRSVSSTTPAERLLLLGWLDDRSFQARLDDSINPLGWVQNLLDENGAELARLLRGEFCLAYVGTSLDDVYLIRSVNCKIPLYWRIKAGVLSWSSNPVSLLDEEMSTIENVDRETLSLVVAGMEPSPDRSWFTPVNRLPSGHLLHIDEGGRQPLIRRYDEFSPQPRRIGMSIDDDAIVIKDAVRAACSNMFGDSDRAVLLLSGGLDSASIAYEGQSLGVKVDGVHLKLDDFPGWDEDAELASVVSKACGVELEMYELNKSVTYGGDYLTGIPAHYFPQTDIPVGAGIAAADRATAVGARFVLTGVMADTALTHDERLDPLASAGWSWLNPTVTGKSLWHNAREMLGASGRLGRFIVNSSSVRASPGSLSPRPLGFGNESAALVRAASERYYNILRAVQSRQPIGNPLVLGAEDALRRGKIRIERELNSLNTDAAWCNQYAPRGCYNGTPYGDRDLIDICLGMPARARLGVAHGLIIDKYALRWAYAQRGLPHRVGQRMTQGRFDAIATLFVHNNFDVCKNMLGDGGLLEELEILEPRFTAEIDQYRSPEYGSTIARYCIVERWLRGLSNAH